MSHCVVCEPAVPKGSFKLDNNSINELVLTVEFALQKTDQDSVGSVLSSQTSSSNQTGDILTALATILNLPQGNVIVPV